jgi:hypothetical protein
MVVVAAFSKYSAMKDKTIRSKSKMRIDLIAADPLLTRIEGTEEDVPESVLDDDGRYYPDA